MRIAWVFILPVFIDVILCVIDYRFSHRSDEGMSYTSLLREWVVSGIRWLILKAVIKWAKNGSCPSSALQRWVTTHCFLAPVFFTGRMVMLGSFALEKSWVWLLNGVVAASACLFWEMSWPDKSYQENGEKTRQTARALFKRVLILYRPDYLLLFGAFVFLSLAVLCEMFIPFYTGRVIDILKSQYHWNDFLTAIMLMGFFSLGSSISAGCRGGLFMCAINSFNCRVRVKLFRSLVGQEIGFYETTKTGDLTSRLSTDTDLMARAVAMNVNVLLRTFIKTLGMLSLMVSLSWKLTVLMLMETPITGFLQNIYDTFYQAADMGPPELYDPSTLLNTPKDKQLTVL